MISIRFFWGRRWGRWPRRTIAGQRIRRRKSAAPSRAILPCHGLLLRCGCKIPRRLTEANLLASRLALELLAWDKARSQRRLGAEAPELESLIARGENAYQRLLLFLHGEGRPAAVEEGEAWLKESGRRRAGRRDVEEVRTSLLPGRPKLNLGEEDYELLDRMHPGRSFERAGEGETAVEIAERLF